MSAAPAGDDAGRAQAPSAVLMVDEMYPVHADGIAVRFVEVRPGLRLRVLEAGPAGGPPIVLFHGWGASVYSYRAAIPALAANGFHVVAADLPGHGLSDKPSDLDRYTRESMVAAAGALLDILDLRAATVVGVSLGGAIVIGLVVAHHPRVARAAVINPVGFAAVRFTTIAQLLSPMALRDYASYVVARPLVSLFLHLAYADATRLTEHDVDEYWAAASRPGFAAALVALLHRFSWEPYPIAELERVACPVLLVIGTRDHLIRDSEDRARAIPRLRIAYVDGGHAVNESCPDAVNAELLAFARE